MSLGLHKDKSLKDLVDILRAHYNRQAISEWNKRPHESIVNYLASLRQLASLCDFGAFLSDALQKWLVCGMSNENIQKVLLIKHLRKSSGYFAEYGSSSTPVNELQGSLHCNNQVLAIQTLRKPCGRCGHGNHSEQEYHFVMLHAANLR